MSYRFNIHNDVREKLRFMVITARVLHYSILRIILGMAIVLLRSLPVKVYAAVNLIFIV